MKVQPYSFYLLDTEGTPIGAFEMDLFGDHPNIDDRIFQIALKRYADGLLTKISTFDYKGITHYVKKVNSRVIIIGFCIDRTEKSLISPILEEYIYSESFEPFIKNKVPGIIEFKKQLNTFLIQLLNELDQQSTQHFTSLINRDFAYYHVYS